MIQANFDELNLIYKRILFYFTKGRQTLVDGNSSNSDMPAKNTFG